MKSVVNIVLNNFGNDSRVWKTSSSLLDFGNKVTVVAVHDKGMREKEKCGEVEVERIKLLSRSWPRYKPVQLLKYLEFIFRVFCRFRDVDVVHCNDLSALPVGFLIKIFGNNVSVVYDCHEYETETNALKGVEKKAKQWLERFLIRFADNVITVSDSIAQEYVRLYDIAKPRLVMNCPAFQDKPSGNIFRETLGIREDQKIFLYQGALSKGRGVELLLEAFLEIDSDKNVVVFMGYGTLQKMVQDKACLSNNVFFHPAVSPSDILSYTSSADYGVSFIEDSCLNYRYCLPNKVFEYLMAGIPVVTSSLYEMKRLVESEGVGIAAEENTVEGVRKAVIASLSSDYVVMQKNVHEARKKYCWENEEKVLKEIYDGL